MPWRRTAPSRNSGKRDVISDTDESGPTHIKNDGSIGSLRPFSLSGLERFNGGYIISLAPEEWAERLEEIEDGWEKCASARHFQPYHRGQTYCRDCEQEVTS
jgi:hypothetical protein